MQRLAMINTDNFPVFCGNRCRNTKCSRHKSNLYNCSGACRIQKLRDTPDCEGCVPLRRKKEE